MDLVFLEKYKPLSQAQAEELLLKNGKNIIVGIKKTPLLIRLFKELLSPLILFLLVVAAFSFYRGESDDAIFIIAVVAINMIVTYIQDYKAEKGLSALKEMLSPQAKVYRDNEVRYVLASDLVLGDIVMLENGDRIPADGTLISQVPISANESQLNGESLPVDKDHLNNNMLYMGTFITSGKGYMKIDHIGMDTKLGEITKQVTKKSFDITPIEIKMNNLTKYVILSIVLLFVFLILLTLARGSNLESVFPSLVALSISSTPESLPVILLLVLSIGAYRMQKRNVILRNLPSTATLAGVDVICTDKTGTLTEGKLKLIQSSFSYDNDLINKAILCNSADSNSEGMIGDLLDVAILEFANQNDFNISKIRNEFKLIGEIPFDSEYKYHSTLHRTNKSTNLLIVKGAVEKVVKLCKNINEKEIFKQETELALEGYKIIAVASKESHVQDLGKEDLKDLNFDGLLVFADTLRKDVDNVIKNIISSGIKVIMITGDQINAATNIARKLNILDSDPNHIILNGTDFEHLADVLDKNEVKDLSLIARATPTQKLELVEMLTSQGKTVAMTGDGVNDAPALVKADIGISMGIGGTDVSRESSDMVLVNNDFTAIVNAIEEARVVFENIRKVVTYLFSTAIGETLTVVVVLLLTGQSPLTATQFLFLNLATDGALDLALATEQKEDKFIGFNPKRYKRNIVTLRAGFKILLIGLLVGYFAILMNSVYLANETARYKESATLVFLTVIQYFVALSVRTNITPLIKVGLFTNKSLIAFIIISTLSLLLVTLVPFGQRFMDTEPVKIDVWVIGILFGLAIVFIEEIRKKLGILVGK